MTVEEWFERRSYDHSQFADLDSLARRKRELGMSVSVVLPARETASTIGPIIDALRELERREVLEQLLVVAADSADGTAAVAAEKGAEVALEHDLLPGFGPTLGKGDAMWRALSVVRGDLVVYLDSDTTNFGAHFVSGLLGPLLEMPGVSFVKAAYGRPWPGGNGAGANDGGRVTELTAKPLLNLFYPELAGFAQPLAGELAAPAALLRSIPFMTGYAVEIGMMIDVLAAAGLDAMAQVDLGTRRNSSRPLHDLSPMSFAVLRAVTRRLEQAERLAVPAPDHDGAETSVDYVHAVRSGDALTLDTRPVELVERPPLSGVLLGAR
jgi:glucosyl-3-phosphoglycerate synthase